MKLKKLGERWKKASRLYTELYRQERQAERKASKAKFNLIAIESRFTDEFQKSVKAEKPIDKVVELGRLLTEKKIKFYVHRRKGSDGYGSQIPTYRIVIRDKKSLAKIKNLEGGLFEVKLTALSDDYVARPFQGTMTFVVYIYENYDEIPTSKPKDDRYFDHLLEEYRKLTPKGTIPA